MFDPLGPPSGIIDAMRAHPVTERRFIRADQQRLFDLVADPRVHPVIDGSGSVRASGSGNPPRLYLGATFSMSMRLAAPYRIRNRVVEFEDGHRIAWRHFNGHVWRYRFEPVADGTLVTEQWDPTRARHQIALRVLGFPRRNRRGMRATLGRLADLATLVGDHGSATVRTGRGHNLGLGGRFGSAAGGQDGPEQDEREPDEHPEGDRLAEHPDPE
jgi:Polyketide cyclase / dehydrase and lipid transport